MSAANATACPPAEVKICEVGGKGYFMPPPWENEWAQGPRAILYLILLFWCFMGVAIVADVFMASIEKITSKKKTVIIDKEKGTVKTTKVWNDTVANLTLMALGSSAPEILLNVIEICAGGFKLGPLGASTIVGSAAFNLLVISAVCVIAIEGGDIRYIKDTTVYSITAFFSVFAYVWLLIIVQVSSPDVVDLWEALVTFLMFPLLTALAYMADIGKFDFLFGYREPKVDLTGLSNEEISHYEMKVLQRYGTGLPDEKIAELLEKEFGPKVSRAAYRVKASIANKEKEKPASTKTSQVLPQDDSGVVKSAVIQFASSAYTVMESIGELEIMVTRSGTVEEGTVKVGYKTIDGTAQGGKDFEIAEGVLEFQKGVSSRIIKIPIINDTDLEKDEYFKVELLNLVGDHSASVSAELGDISTCEIRIIDDDDPGQLCFKTGLMRVTEDTHEKTVVVHVERRNGSRGVIGVNYKTEDDSAKAGMDYEEANGTLTLKDGQAEGLIELTIKPRGRYENEEKFRVILEEPTGGATLVESEEADTTTCTVIIESDGAARDRVDRVVKLMQLNWDKTAAGNTSWKQQFIDALSVSGGDDDDEDAGPPGPMDYVMHVISVFWKVLFAAIPPPDYCDGWLCFCIALLMIGVVTTVISDLANLVGCCLGMPGEITAITIVALGTSLPDTFASKSAAEQDPYADASVGNVTGSNSVNVFLGLGLPWMIASIYWMADGDSSTVFNVPAGNLGTSVATFCGCATVAIGILALRRKLCGGELGGPSGLKWASFAALLGLWLVYIVVSSIVVINGLTDCD